MAIRYVDKPFTVTATVGSSATLTEETGTTADNNNLGHQYLPSIKTKGASLKLPGNSSRMRNQIRQA